MALKTTARVFSLPQLLGVVQHIEYEQGYWCEG